MRSSPPNTRLRWIGLIGGLALVVVLAGCGDDDGEESSSDTTAAGDTTTSLINSFTSCEDIPETQGGALNEGATANMIDFEFCQTEIVVEAGQTIEFVNNGAVRHQVAHDPPGEQEREFKAPEAMLPGDNYVITLDTPGVYPFICSFHFEDGMTGQITVE